MVAVNIYGGLGNQLFQYAFGKSIATLSEDDLYIDTSLFENYDLRNFQLDKFNVCYQQSTSNKLGIYNINNKYKLHALRLINKYLKLFPNIFFEKELWVFDDKVFNSTSIIYVGYWQSFKYFENIRDLLLQEFTLKNSIGKINLDILSKITASNSISIHIRRGDYVATNSNHTISVCSIAYYEEAIKIMIDDIQDPVFFIFSDDIEWVKSNLNLTARKCVYVDNNSSNPEFDLELMKNCKHNIIANSTFSWWGAWLNDTNGKKIIAPKIWMYGAPVSKDLVPSDWILL
jgi:hypothetical protein